MVNHLRFPLLLSALGLFTLFGQEPAVGQTFSGSLDSGLGWYYGSVDILSAGPRFTGSIEGKVGSEDNPVALYFVEGSATHNPASSPGKGNLGEAWVTVFAGPFDLSVGNQIIAWGVTDVFTPSDVVNPWDRTLPVDASKLPVPLGRLLLNGSEFSLDVVLVPVFSPGVLPTSRWQTASALVPPSGVTIVEKTVTEVIPATAWDNAAAGARAALSLDLFQGVDLGLTVYRGRSAIPQVTRNFVATGTPGQVRVQSVVTYDRFWLAGADAVASFDSGVLFRFEAAGSLWRDSGWESPKGGNVTAEAVGSVEYTLPIVGVKAMAEAVVDWTNSAGWEGQATMQTVGALSAQPDSRWSWKAVGAWNHGGAGMLSPQVTYAVADGLNLTLRSFSFWGDRDETWGAWTDNDLVDLTLRYAF